MFRSLYGKLALALVALFIAVGCLFALLMTASMDMYQQEVSQKLHRDIASYLVDNGALTLDTEGAKAAMKDLFESVMIVNPNVEVYLLDANGSIVSHSLAPDALGRTRVDTGPIQQFIAGEELPIFGDDPRQTGEKKIFSAAAVHEADEISGYLYVISGGERYESMVSMLRGSHIMRLSAAGAIAAIVFSVLAGLMIFAVLTRRLRQLSANVASFEQDGRFNPNTLPAKTSAPGDEIDRLGDTIRDMAERTASRMGDLEHADQLRRELVANVSHDLRTPLASLQGYLDTVLMKYDDLSESERKKYVETAARHSQRLGTLIGELFELAYLDANDQPPEREPFSLEDLAQDVMQDFELQTNDAGVVLEVDPPPELPLVYGNIGMIERVLENLIRNSLRHTPSGGEVRLALSPRRNAVNVQLSDTGCGIATEDLPYIFDRFYQPHQERGNNGSSGVGLGLAISRRILELHGSKIDVRSKQGKGTIFTFDLPTLVPSQSTQLAEGMA